MWQAPANAGIAVWASAANTFSAAGSATSTPTLPGGAIGFPRVVRASGNVSGQVVVNISNNQQVIVPVNPNAPFTEVAIPASAFPIKTGQVSVTLTSDGAGTIRALIGFAP